MSWGTHEDWCEYRSDLGLYPECEECAKMVNILDDARRAFNDVVKQLYIEEKFNVQEFEKAFNKLNLIVDGNPFYGELNIAQSPEKMIPFDPCEDLFSHIVAYNKNVYGGVI